MQPRRNRDISLRIIEAKAAMREVAQRWRCEGKIVGLVPTMGALHAGHQALIRRARGQCDRLVVSIFVNPLQFDSGADLQGYPRRLDRDLSLASSERVDVAFAPSSSEMYRDGALSRVQVLELGEQLEGAHRPGHFEGMLTVVAKLFNIVRPHRAYFGQKDAQQAALVRRMAEDLDMEIDLAVLPTVRESDGLALSSRNAKLTTTSERRAALRLFQALQVANHLYLEGERDPDHLRAALRADLEAEPLAAIDYAEVVDPVSFQPPGTLAVLAVRIGATRLIDNHQLGEPLSEKINDAG